MFGQFLQVARKLSDALRKLLGGHGVFVQHPAEILLVQLQLRRVRILSRRRVDPSLEPAVHASEFPEQARGIVKRSHPASLRISPVFRKLAPITSVR